LTFRRDDAIIYQVENGHFDIERIAQYSQNTRERLHKMIEQMFERLIGYRNIKMIHAGKVRASPLTGIIYLRKENLF